MKICSFFGHREVLDDIDETLQEHIRYAIHVLRVTEFYVGGYGAFDRKVVDAMVAIRQEYSRVKLFLSLAYLNTASAKEYDVKRYDGTVFLEGLEYGVKRFAISKRNRLMVNDSDVIICYITHNHGGDIVR